MLEIFFDRLKLEKVPKILFLKDDDFLQFLEKNNIKEFSVNAIRNVSVENKQPVTRYYTEFKAEIPKSSGKQGIIVYYKPQQEVAGIIPKVEQKIYSDTAIITAEKDLNRFLDKNGKKIGGMYITGPMAEMKMKDIKRIEKITPFRPKKSFLPNPA